MTLPLEYELVREVGRGSFGVVVLARHRVLGRLVAIKQIAGAALLDPDAVSRFGREARALAAAQHPSVVEVYDLTQSGGRWFMIMEYVAGPTLRTRLLQNDMASPDRLAVVAGLADALSTAHARGVLHRDVKPSNVLLTAQGRAKLADFGLARLADPTAFRTALPGVAGTRGYLAPELLAGHPPDQRTDTYAFAVMALETLTGRRPDASQLSGAGGGREVDVLRAALDPTAANRPTMPEIARTLARAEGSPVKRPAGHAHLAGPVADVAHPALHPAGDFDGATDARVSGEVTTGPQPSEPSSPTDAQVVLALNLAGRAPDATNPLPPIFDPGPPPRRRRVGRAAAGAGVGVGVAAVTAALIAATTAGPDLVVTSVSSSISPPVGECPEATFVLTAEVVTNGGRGEIVTRWLQPDGRATDSQAQLLAEGQTRLTATLTFVQMGQESRDALARFEVLSPNAMASPLVLRYVC